MMQIDEQALICDLAETYRIYDYRSLPARKVAIFCVGLRENSRIRMKMAGEKVNAELSMLAAIIDRLSYLIWGLSEDGAKGIHQPVSIFDMLHGREVEKNVSSFDSPEEFEKRRKELIGGR